MTINKRIKQVRKTLHLSQIEFSKAIYISGNGYIAEIENEHRVANDRIIHLISLTYGVNEHWLKTGEGEMFQKSPVEKRERITNIFNALNPRFQDYAVQVIDQLLHLQEEESQEARSDASKENR